VRFKTRSMDNHGGFVGAYGALGGGCGAAMVPLAAFIAGLALALDKTPADLALDTQKAMAIAIIGVLCVGMWGASKIREKAVETRLRATVDQDPMFVAAREEARAREIAAAEAMELAQIAAGAMRAKKGEKADGAAGARPPKRQAARL
jgi:hypothetical protein